MNDLLIFSESYLARLCPGITPLIVSGVVRYVTLFLDSNSFKFLQNMQHAITWLDGDDVIITGWVCQFNQALISSKMSQLIKLKSVKLYSCKVFSLRSWDATDCAVWKNKNPSFSLDSDFQWMSCVSHENGCNQKHWTAGLVSTGHKLNKIIDFFFFF